MSRALAIAVLLLTACEKTDHDSIEKWGHTQKGPGKLKKALRDDGLDPDMSAHAAIVMITHHEQEPDVRAALNEMPAPRKQAVIKAMAPRLWQIARLEKENDLPVGDQSLAKDWLFNLRKDADDATRAQIDGYLLDWYAVPSYPARQQAGMVQGVVVMRALGAPAGKKMVSVVNGIIAAPGQEKTRLRIDDTLLVALAASGNPEAVTDLLDIMKMDRGDKTLGERAMNALYKAYIDTRKEFELADAKALEPSLQSFVDLASNDTTESGIADDAAALIRAIGMPKCLPALLGIIPKPHANAKFRYAAPNNALLCGGAPAIVDTIKAMPDLPYSKDELDGSIVLTISKLEPKDQVLAALRTLLADKGKVEKWVAIEALAAMKSTEDAPKIAALAKDREVLTGFWGSGGGGKPEPTLGARATELAATLGK